jgi:hypothetical protein
LRAAKLKGYQETAGRWKVEVASVQDHLAKFGQKPQRPPGRGELAAEVQRLADAVRRLEGRERDPSGHLDALTRERDRYRADAATMREAALRLNALAGDACGAMRQTLEMLDQQRDALAQLLSPGSPQDLMQ